MADELKPGDVVRLKSGGPKMTVSKIDGSRLWCEWFDDKNKHDGRYFEAHLLEKAGGLGMA